jgi:hypothetical protein
MFSLKFGEILIVSCALSFGLNVTLVLFIANAAALTVTLAGVFKDVMLIVLSVLILRSSITLVEIVGYSTALIAVNIHREFKKDDGRSLQKICNFGADVVAENDDSGISLLSPGADTTV